MRGYILYGSYRIALSECCRDAIVAEFLLIVGTSNEVEEWIIIMKYCGIEEAGAFP
jgi:hypothetical protein